MCERKLGMVLSVWRGAMVWYIKKPSVGSLPTDGFVSF